MAVAESAGEWQGPYPSREEVTRDRIMDACVRAIAGHGLEGLKLKHIIDQSGLSRQTIYNHYGNRNEIIQAAFTREGITVCQACADVIRPYDSAQEQFVKGFMFMFEALPANPVLRQIIDHHYEFLNVVGLDNYPLQQFGSQCFGEVFAASPRLAASAEEISDFWARSLLSTLLFSGSFEYGEGGLEGYVRRRLLPGLGLSA